MTERATHGVAVIGLGCLFPGADGPERFWRNIENGHDAITEASEARWDSRFHDPDATAVDRVYTRRGGFLADTLPFDAAAFGIMPAAVEGADPDQLVALQVAARCLEDAGYRERDHDGSRAGVILGRGSYVTPGLVRLNRKVREAEQLAVLLRELAPDLDAEVVERVKAAFQEAAGAYGPDTAIGLVPNLTASRIANRLDLQGPAYTVDAACASALIAVEHACRELRSGRCDLMLAGGVHLTQDVTLWSLFSQLGAMSRTGVIRPFDRRADGLLIGEGVGILALKRLDRAERDGDRIYAVLHGVGSASDGRASSVMVPLVEGQVRALRRAWTDAGLEPSAIGLLEAHGTGTLAGDAAELQTLAEVFGPAEGSRRAVVGSVKSMIGHAMPAAGAAGLIKAVLAVHHGVLPPTLHCEEPRPELEHTRFEPLAASRPWDQARGRLAAVNAFGFGGINAHVVVGSHGEAVARARRTHKSADRVDVPVVMLAAPDPEALLEALDAGARRGGEGPCRLAVVDPTEKRLARARNIVARGAPWPGRGGMWFRPRGLLDDGGRIALLFPGVEARFQPEVASIASHFDLPPPACTRPADLEETGYGVVALGRFLHTVLEQIGVRADAYAGHSIGEWTGMIASGVLPDQAADDLLASLRPGSLEVPGVVFAAAGCGAEVAEAAIADLDRIAISHDNCPHQVILCGHASSIDIARERLIERGVICQVLPFRSGFHSPLFADYLEPHRRHFAALPVRPAATPLYSATTCAPYPEPPEEIRALAVEHLVRPLRFRELTEALYEAGFRVFIQAGTGSLTGFVDDCLGQRPHLAVSAIEERRSGMAQLRNLALALFVEGVEVDMDGLVPAPTPRVTVPLFLGSPLVRLPSLRGLLSAQAPRQSGAVPADSPVLAELGRTMEALGRAGEDVVRALHRRAPARWSRRRHLSVQAIPALGDHAFFPQPEGWPCLSDRHPVVPMTMILDLLVEAASGLAPGQVPIAVQGLRVHQWLPVEPMAEVELRAALSEDGWIEAEVADYANALIRRAPQWPDPPPPALGRPTSPRPTPVDAEALYAERWMFHGPSYQGVVALGPYDDTGIEGVIRTPNAPGALLDNAGQLLGYWLMISQDRDRLGMPTGVDSVEWFGPTPLPGTAVQCRVSIRSLSERTLRADLELVHEGRLWCRIGGWTDHRFETDARVWEVMQHPERSLLSEVCDPWVRFDERQCRVPSREWLMRRYLGEAERQAMLATEPHLQRSFLNDRVVAKDALRRLLWADGTGSLFPVEVPLGVHPQELVLGGAFATRDLRVSVAHAGPVWVALAGEGRAVGIDIAQSGSDPATRLQCARRAVARARGLAPGSNPAHLVVQEGDDRRLVVDGTPVGLAEDGPHLVAWTLE